MQMQIVRVQKPRNYMSPEACFDIFKSLSIPYYKINYINPAHKPMDYCPAHRFPGGKAYYHGKDGAKGHAFFYGAFYNFLGAVRAFFYFFNYFFCHLFYLS